MKPGAGPGEGSRTCQASHQGARLVPWRRWCCPQIVCLSRQGADSGMSAGARVAQAPETCRKPHSKHPSSLEGGSAEAENLISFQFYFITTGLFQMSQRTCGAQRTTL